MSCSITLENSSDLMKEGWCIKMHDFRNVSELRTGYPVFSMSIVRMVRAPVILLFSFKSL